MCVCMCVCARSCNCLNVLGVVSFKENVKLKLQLTHKPIRQLKTLHAGIVQTQHATDIPHIHGGLYQHIPCM